MRLRVSENVMRRLKKLSAVFDKPIPIVKYRIPDRLRVGDIIVIRSKSISSRAKVCDIKEVYVCDSRYFFSHVPNVCEELNLVYGDKLKEMLNNKHISKIYLVYVKILS